MYDGYSAIFQPLSKTINTILAWPQPRISTGYVYDLKTYLPGPGYAQQRVIAPSWIFLAQLRLKCIGLWAFSTV